MSKELVLKHELVVKYGKVKYLTESGEDWLLREARNLKHRSMIVLMLDCGLRVTECLWVKWKDFDFGNQSMNVYTIKDKRNKKGKEKVDLIRRDIKRVRIVPMTRLVIETLGNYLDSYKKRPHGNELLFGSKDNIGFPIKRQGVDRFLKKLMPELSAHVLRHTYATKQRVGGTKLEVLQKLLGHTSITSTEVYTHIPMDILMESRKVLEKDNFISRIRNRFVRKNDLNVVFMERGQTKFHVGRRNEMEVIATAMKRKENLLITGRNGIGKTHLLENMKSQNIIRIDEVKSPKTLVGDLLIELYKNEFLEDAGMEGFTEEQIRSQISETNIRKAVQQNVIKLAIGNAKLENYVQSNSVKSMLDILFMCTKKEEITLLIDDVTKTTPNGIRLLEQLKNHFHIIAAARNVHLKNLPAFSNYRMLKLEELKRHEQLKMIDIISKPFRGRIKDWVAYTDHIMKETKGNPQYIIDMVGAFRKMNHDIDTHTIRSQKHISSSEGISIFPVLVVLIALTSVMRYARYVTGDKTNMGFYYMIAAIGIIALYMMRPLIQSARRKSL